MNEAPQAQNINLINTQPTLFPISVERIQDAVYSQKINASTPQVKKVSDIQKVPYIVVAKNNALGVGQMN